MLAVALECEALQGTLSYTHLGVHLFWQIMNKQYIYIKSLNVQPMYTMVDRVPLDVMEDQR